MRYRALDADGDYTFGRGQANFLVDSPACVGQLVLTRLRLWEGEWFLDEGEGTPYEQKILGKGTVAVYDLAIRARILETQGVTGIQDYASSRDEQRRLAVTARVSTQYGTDVTISTVLD